MAINTTSARMKQLHGKYAELDKTQMLQGEIAVPSDHGPIVCKQAGAKFAELLTKEDEDYFENLVEEVTTSNTETQEKVAAFDLTKLDKSVANTMVKDVTFDESTGIFTVTKLNGSTFTIDTKLEKIAVNFRFDKVNQILFIILDDGTEQPIDISALITQYEFLDSDTVVFTISVDGKVSANIKDGSITDEKLEPNYLANVTVQASKAETSADAAAQSASDADYNAKLAQSYAIGGSGIRDGENTDNAKYYAEQAKSANVIDTEMSETSINPVQNKVITKALGNKQDKLTNPLTKSDVVNNLTTSTTNVPLSAAQGKALNDKLDNKQDKQDSSLTTSAKTVSGAINELVATTNAINQNLSGKQDKLTAGTNVSITGNTISATDTTYSAGNGLVLNGTSFSVNPTYKSAQGNTTSQGEFTKTITVNKTGVILISATIHSDTTNDNGSASVDIISASVRYGSNFVRLNPAEGLRISANASAIIDITNTAHKPTIYFNCSKAGTKDWYVNVTSLNGADITIS